MDNHTLEKNMKILADKTRLHILQLIYQGEQCGCELIHKLNISQPTLSHHLKVLSDHGFIKGIKKKNRVNYTASIHRIKVLFENAITFITKTENC